MTSVVFIHGLANKPEAAYLHALWKRKLAHDDGLDLDGNGVDSVMSYWADVLYPSPDTHLADYESAGSEALAEAAPVTTPVESAQAMAADPRMRDLAAALGVDLEAPVEQVPSATEVIAVQHESVPLPGWLKQKLMARFARDAFLYFHNEPFSPRPGTTCRVRDELRRRFMASLREAAALGGPVVVVSHSMGTIIAYDCLKHEPDCPAVQGLVTLGSPLGLDEVQAFFPRWTRDDGFPSDKLQGRWINVFDPLDPVVGLDPRFANDFRRGGQAAVEDVREDNWGTWRHSISKYLQGKLLRQHLGELLGVPWP